MNTQVQTSTLAPHQDISPAVPLGAYSNLLLQGGHTATIILSVAILINSITNLLKLWLLIKAQNAK